MAVSLPPAANGLVVFLLSASVVLGHKDQEVTYTSTEICALEGSTVNIRCSYRYPPRTNGRDTAVEETLWFNSLRGKESEDLRSDPEYSGRVQSSCDDNSCTLTITDVRESDSAEYKFTFTTNQPGGSYTDSPGVTLSVTGLQAKTIASKKCKVERCTWVDLMCHSSCPPPHPTSYIWYKNGQELHGQKSHHNFYSYGADSFSCAVKGHTKLASPSVCGHGQQCNRVTYTSRSICAFKGSTVDISCSYSGYNSIKSKFWFRPDRRSRWHSPQYAGRIQVFETSTGRSTLRISDLTVTDSAEYRFKFTAGHYEWGSSLAGTTLTVTDPDLKVLGFRSSAGPKLICHSSCLTDQSNFVWYKNGVRIDEETTRSYRGHVDPGANYSCSYSLTKYRSPPVYAPKVPSVLIDPSGDIFKGNSVALSCSSDASPSAKYMWYKENLMLTYNDPHLIFNSIQSSDLGHYHCTAENKLGKTTSKYLFVNVKYGPTISAVSVSPSGEIMEGSSVNLTCSSVANPAATYTWYKENQTLLHGPENIYQLISISSNDTGLYHCRSENQYGQMNSSVFIDVEYAPKLPSVSVSPSGEIVEGSSVNLSCSSDANPAANYTWYKEDEESPKASGQTFIITDFRPEHSGHYICEASNIRGRHNSTLQLVVTGTWKSAAIGTTIPILLVILLAAFLWIRRNKSFTQQNPDQVRTHGSAQANMIVVHDYTAASQQDDVHYAAVTLCLDQEDALYSNIGPAQRRRQAQDEEEEDGVEYTIVKTDPGTRSPTEDSFPVYSTVNKNYENAT